MPRGVAGRHAQRGPRGRFFRGGLEEAAVQDGAEEVPVVHHREMVREVPVRRRIREPRASSSDLSDSSRVMVETEAWEESSECEQPETGGEVELQEVAECQQQEAEVGFETEAW